MVMQQPESQIITDRVYQELAFGLESMGIKQEELRLRGRIAAVELRPGGGHV